MLNPTKWYKKTIMRNLIICALLAIIILLLFSCGTRKNDTQIKDSIHIENNYSQGTKIVLGNTFTYTPFDALKPMVVEGKKYENAIVSNDKSIAKTNWNNRYITKTIVIDKKKKTEKSDNTILLVLIALIVCGFIFLYFYLPKLKTGI